MCARLLLCVYVFVYVCVSGIGERACLLFVCVYVCVCVRACFSVCVCVCVCMYVRM